MVQRGSPDHESSTEWGLGDDLSVVNTPQDYTEHFLTGSPCRQKPPDSSLVFSSKDVNLKSKATLSTSSDQESGIADLSCRSPLSEDSTRDPDSDEAA